MPPIDLAPQLMRLLEASARALSVSSFPSASPPQGPPDVPEVQVERDDDGEISVYRFARVVADDVDPSPLEVRRRDLGDDVDADVGDEVGVDVPLPIAAATALLLVRVQLSRRADDAFRPIADDLWDNIISDGHVDGLVCELEALSGASASAGSTSAPLSRVLGLCALHPDKVRGLSRLVIDDGDGAGHELAVLVLADDVNARVLVITSDDVDAAATLLAALAPLPPFAPKSLGARLQDASLYRADHIGDDINLGVRADEVVVKGDGVVAVALRTILRQQSGDVVDESAARVTLRVSPLALRQVVDDVGAERLRVAMTRFAERALRSLRPSTSPSALLDHSAWLRVATRAALQHALVARGNVALGVADIDDEGAIAIDVDDVELVVSTADEALLVRDQRGALHVVYQNGRTIDGDDEAARAVAHAIAGAIVGSDADIDLVIVDDNDDEREDLVVVAEGAR